MAKETARENKPEAIEKSATYNNTKVKFLEFQEGELVLFKVHNFLGKNRKLSDTFKGPYITTTVNENGTIRMNENKHARQDQLVNQNQLVKYKLKKLSKKLNLKRAYNKRVFHGREDGGPVTKRKNHPVSKLNEVGRANHKCKPKLIYHS